METKKNPKILIVDDEPANLQKLKRTFLTDYTVHEAKTGDEALLLVERTRGAALLRGFRGKPPLDRRKLAEIMVGVGELIGSGLLEEIDLNPVVLYPRGALVLDAKMKKVPAQSSSIK